MFKIFVKRSFLLVRKLMALVRIFDRSRKSIATGSFYGNYFRLFRSGNLYSCGNFTDSEITVENVVASHLDIFWEKLHEVGAEFVIDEAKKEIRTKKTKTRFYADQNSNRRFSSISHGSSSTIWGSYDAMRGNLIHFETLFERKFAYLLELEKLGADVTIANPSSISDFWWEKASWRTRRKPRYSCWSKECFSQRSVQKENRKFQIFTTSIVDTKN